MFNTVFHQMQKQLAQLDTWFEKATAYATAKKFDPSLFLQFRIAPDMLPFVTQVRIATDTAKLAASRLTGKDAPVFEDKETTLTELVERVAKTRAYLESVTEADLANAATRTISTPRWEGKTMTGQDYFMEHALPNFYFHIAMTYALLRHNGVELGKKDYLGPLSLK